jgi:MraZ protein
MLIGHYVGRINEKGRVALPAKFRQFLGERVVVARWYENCLAVVAEKDWERLVTGLGEQRLVSAARDTDRFLLSGAFEIDLDGQGRFVVPSVLREYANLAGEVVFAGVGDRVEIWEKGKFDSYQTALVGRAAEVVEKYLGGE